MQLTFRREEGECGQTHTGILCAVPKDRERSTSRLIGYVCTSTYTVTQDGYILYMYMYMCVQYSCSSEIV